MKVTTDILTRDGKDIAFGDYSATWKFHRKIVHAALCMFGEGSASIEKTSEYSSLLQFDATLSCETACGRQLSSNKSQQADTLV